MDKRRFPLAAAGLGSGLLLAAAATLVTLWSAPDDALEVNDRPEELNLALSDGDQRSTFAGFANSVPEKIVLELDEAQLAELLEPASGPGNLELPSADDVRAHVPPIVYEETQSTQVELASLPSLPRDPARHAQPGQALLSIIIDDVGPSWRHSVSAVELPYPITLAFLPYAEGIPDLVRRAETNGHEIMLHLPMEPIGSENPGPNALLTDLDDTEFERRLNWAMERVPNYVGVNNHMGSRLTSEPEAMSKVMAAVRERGAFFVDSKTSPRSVAAQTASSVGLRQATRDIFLDNERSVEAIIRQLRVAARVAHSRGSSIAIGHPYPETIEALKTWLPQAMADGIAFVPVSEIIKYRDCQRLGKTSCIELVALQ